MSTCCILCMRVLKISMNILAAVFCIVYVYLCIHKDICIGRMSSQIHTGTYTNKQTTTRTCVPGGPPY